MEQKKDSSYSPFRQFMDNGNMVHYSVQSSVFHRHSVLYTVASIYFVPQIKHEKQSDTQVLYFLLLVDLSHETGSWDMTTIMQK